MVGVVFECVDRSHSHNPPALCEHGVCSELVVKRGPTRGMPACPFCRFDKHGRSLPAPRVQAGHRPLRPLRRHRSFDFPDYRSLALPPSDR
jgi:hypothetical protein